jgi:hypothetical protein
MAVNTVGAVGSSSSPHAWQYGQRHEAHLRSLEVHHQAAEEAREAVLNNARRAWVQRQREGGSRASAAGMRACIMLTFMLGVPLHLPACLLTW